MCAGNAESLPHQKECPSCGKTVGTAYKQLCKGSVEGEPCGYDWAQHIRAKAEARRPHAAHPVACEAPAMSQSSSDLACRFRRVKSKVRAALPGNSEQQAAVLRSLCHAGGCTLL